MTIPQLKSDLTNLVNDFKPILHETSIQQLHEWIGYNEIKLTVEMLSEYISETGIPLNQELLDRVNEFCRILNIDEVYWL